MANSKPNWNFEVDLTTATLYALAGQPKSTIVPLHGYKTLRPDGSLELDFTITSLQLSSLLTDFRCHSELQTHCACWCSFFILDAVQRISLNLSLQHPSCHVWVAYTFSKHSTIWSATNNNDVWRTSVFIHCPAAGNALTFGLAYIIYRIIVFSSKRLKLTF